VNLINRRGSSLAGARAATAAGHAAVLATGPFIAHRGIEPQSASQTDRHVTI